MSRWALPQEELGFLKGKGNVRVECHSAKLSAEEESQGSPFSGQYCLQQPFWGPSGGRVSGQATRCPREQPPPRELMGW